jgi:hypothetical protein
MHPFSFIHTADLHIDSPFRGVTDAESAPAELAEALYSSTFRAFDGLIETALERRVREEDVAAAALRDAGLLCLDHLEPDQLEGRA